MLSTVAELTSVNVQRVSHRWDFALTHKREIDAHWQRRKSEQPGLFNGRVFMMKRWSLHGGYFNGECFETEFKNFLYWREHDGPDASVVDFFGAGFVHSAEDWLLLGRSGPAMSNAGKIYPPSGSVDAREFHDGHLDLDASIVRELAEETGLEVERSQLDPPLAIISLPQIVIARPIRLGLTVDDILPRMIAHIGRAHPREVSDIVVVRGVVDIDERDMPPFVPLYIRYAFGPDGKIAG